MKLVIWDEDNIPTDIGITEYGELMFEDCKFWFNFEVGDQIQYASKHGVRCYFVVGVEPTDDESALVGVNLVTIEVAG